jgi:hypothetical protein
MSVARAKHKAVLLGCTVVISASRASAQVRVIDMIPRHMSDETFQNAEPSLAVNPKNAARMAASAYTPGGDLCSRRAEAPIFASADSGKHWSVVCKIRVDSSSNLPPGDVTLRWSSDGGGLFAAMLWPLQPITLQVFLTPDPLDAGTFDGIRRVPNVDQPDMQITTIRGKPRVFVAADFFDADTGKHPLSKGTAVVIVTQPHPMSPADSAFIPVEHRDISGRNYAIRLAAHPSGTVYALFYSPRPSNADDPFVIEDVVLVRDDSAGLGKKRFEALRDLPAQTSRDKCAGRDGEIGFRIARCATVPYPAFNDVASFGNQRRVSANLSIAVDPQKASTVWVAWADSSGDDHYVLHVRRSLDAGQTWSADLLTIANATNPALAVTADGTAGFLFQQLQDSGQRWVTRLVTSTDGFTTKRTYTLATTPSTVPSPVIQPYIGDYIELRAVGPNFYGVFSAANTPDTLNFPNGVSFQRNVDLSRRLLLNAHGGTTIGVSIDPFFFAVGPKEDSRCVALRRARSSRADDIGCK